jgi:hypothetical protein
LQDRIKKRPQQQNKLMKKVLVASILGFALSVTSSYGDGYIYMQNYDVVSINGVYTPVYSAITLNGQYVGADSGIQVDLLYSLTGTPGSFTPAPGSQTQFYAGSHTGGAPTIDGAGVFLGPKVVIPGYTGGTAFFIVEAYNGTAFNSPTTTIEGQSAEFSMSISDSPLLYPPDLLNFNAGAVRGLQPFAVNPVPEPSILALSGIGFAALALVRRRK